jgi:hypothetical protein
VNKEISGSACISGSATILALLLFLLFSSILLSILALPLLGKLCDFAYFGSASILLLFLALLLFCLLILALLLFWLQKCL